MKTITTNDYELFTRLHEITGHLFDTEKVASVLEAMDEWSVKKFKFLVKQNEPLINPEEKAYQLYSAFDYNKEHTLEAIKAAKEACSIEKMSHMPQSIGGWNKGLDYWQRAEEVINNLT